MKRIFVPSKGVDDWKPFFEDAGGTMSRGAAAIRKPPAGSNPTDVTSKRPAPQKGSDAATGILHGFPPVESECARVLVLGSMPGAASLRARQYYAHPQNAFWRITGDLFGFDPAAPYAVRTATLAASGVALWDVLMSCERPGSMDSDIETDTIVCNDFASFFGAHRRITRVFFNGATAERLFRKHVRPKLVRGPELRCMRLPSTSPAYASVPYAEKLRAWRTIIPDDVHRCSDTTAADAAD